MCTVLLPPGSYTIAVNKYIVSYHIISYHIISYHIISYHIISYHIISYHISYHIISYHIISYHIISYHISYHITYIISYHKIRGTTSIAWRQYHVNKTYQQNISHVSFSVCSVCCQNCIIRTCCHSVFLISSFWMQQKYRFGGAKKYILTPLKRNRFMGNLI